MLGTFSDDIRHDDSYLISIIESDAPQSQIKFDCILALQGIAGCFGMIQEIPDQFDILVGNPFAAVLFTDSGAYGDASFDGGKTLQPVVIDNRSITLRIIFLFFISLSPFSLSEFTSCNFNHRFN